MFARTSLYLVVLASLVAPSVAAAQQPVAQQPVAQQSVAQHAVAPQQLASPGAAGPRLELTAVAMKRISPADSAAMVDSLAAAMQRRQGMGQPVALMVVGGAAFILGAVIGDAPGALFMIGGAIAFLYGLYNYMK